MKRLYISSGGSIKAWVLDSVMGDKEWFDINGIAVYRTEITKND